MSDLGGGTAGPLGGPTAILGPEAIAVADASGGPDWRRWALIGGLLFAALSIVRVVTDNPDLTSSGTSAATLRLAVPIGLAALGGIYAERSGVVNIGLEGMMILGTWFGAYGAYEMGPWWGVALGVLGGAAGALLHALATVTFNVDHIISGVAIITLATGVTRYLSVTVYEGVPGGGATQSPRVGDVGDFDVPLLSDFLGWFERKGWFLVSDVTGFARGLVTNVSWLTLIAVLLVPFSWWLLWRTVFGLRLRSAGEHPSAADSLGVSVHKMRYAGVLISGALAGLAGAFLSIEAASIYRQGQTGGRGFIGMAAMIFGNWQPLGAALGSALFGFSDALQLRRATAVHALLLFVAILALGWAIWSAYKRRTRPAIIGFVVGGLAALWYFTSDAIANEFVSMTPYVVTLVVLSFATQRLRPPAYSGRPWRKGQVE